MYPLGNRAPRTAPPRWNQAEADRLRRIHEVKPRCAYIPDGLEGQTRGCEGTLGHDKGHVGNYLPGFERR